MKRGLQLSVIVLVISVIVGAYIISNILLKEQKVKEQKVTLSGPYKFEYNEYTLLPYVKADGPFYGANDYYGKPTLYRSGSFYIKADLNEPLKTSSLIYLEQKTGASWNTVSASSAGSTGKSVTFLIYSLEEGTYKFRAFVPDPEVGASGTFSNELLVEVRR